MIIFSKKKISQLVAYILIVLVSCTPSKKYLQRKKLLLKGKSKYVRVLLLKTGRAVSVASKGKLRIKDKKVGRILYDSRKAVLKIHPDRVNNPIEIESGNSSLLINGKPYRGIIEIHNIIGKLYVINVLKIDEYLYGVVPSEIPHTWDAQALKAQAVAARTFTYYHLLKRNKSRIFDLDATTSFQVYKGISVEKPSTTSAVADTMGEIISTNFQPIISYFHSTCGGRTISDKYIWSGGGHAYLKGRKCDYCKESPYYKWTGRLSLYEIRGALKKKYRNIGKIRKISFTKRYGVVIGVSIKHSFGKIDINGNRFRLLFPPKKLKSMTFVSKNSGNGLLLYGRGWGHGVGLCQWGARGLARSGASYRAILKFYYDQVRIVNILNTKSSLIANRNIEN